MAAVGGLADEEWYLHAVGKPLVRGHVELAHRLLVPEVAGLAERATQIDGVGQVEGSRPVVHEVDVIADMCTYRLAQLGVSASISPGMELDRWIAQLEALIDDVEKLLGRCERRRRRVGGYLFPVGPEEPVDGHAEDTPL